MKTIKSTKKPTKAPLLCYSLLHHMINKLGGRGEDGEVKTETDDLKWGWRDSSADVNKSIGLLEKRWSLCVCNADFRKIWSTPTKVYNMKVPCVSWVENLKDAWAEISPPVELPFPSLCLGPLIFALRSEASPAPLHSVSPESGRQRTGYWSDRLLSEAGLFVRVTAGAVGHSLRL